MSNRLLLNTYYSRDFLSRGHGRGYIRETLFLRFFQFCFTIILSLTLLAMTLFSCPYIIMLLRIFAKKKIMTLSSLITSILQYVKDIFRSFITLMKPQTWHKTKTNLMTGANLWWSHHIVVCFTAPGLCRVYRLLGVFTTYYSYFATEVLVHCYDFYIHTYPSMLNLEQQMRCAYFLNIYCLKICILILVAVGCLYPFNILIV